MTPWLRTVLVVGLVAVAFTGFALAYLLAFAPFWPYLLGREPWPYQ